MAKINENLAYDYSAYDEKIESLPEPKIKHKKNLKLIPKPSSAFKFIFFAVTSIVMLSAIVFGQVELSEIYSEQSQMTEELNKLKDENLSLESEFESNTSLTQVENYATKKLGLRKLDKSQIEYVEVPSDKVIEVVTPEDNSIFSSIKSWFNDVLEYFKS